MKLFQKLLKNFNISKSSLTEVTFDNLPFLTQKEAKTGLKGVKLSKSYYFKSKEVIRITYNKIIGDYTYKGIIYPNVYQGVSKKVNYIFGGTIDVTKEMQPFEFNLHPYFSDTLDANGDKQYDGENKLVQHIAGFSSRKQRAILRSERYVADDDLQFLNPEMYAIILGFYEDIYSRYLKSGFKSEFVKVLDNETREDVLSYINRKVAEYGGLEVKELIKMNLQ